MAAFPVYRCGAAEAQGVGPLFASSSSFCSRKPSHAIDIQIFAYGIMPLSRGRTQAWEKAPLLMFAIEYTTQAIDDLRWFKRHEQAVIVDGIEAQLRHEPHVETPQSQTLTSQSDR